MTSVRQDNFIRLRDRFVTAESTSRLVVGNRGRPISRYTVRRRLRERRITCHRPYRGLVLTLRHRHQRLIWARNHRGKRWQNVVFSDESRFNLWDANGRIRVYRRRRERYVNNNCVVENNPYGGGGVMVWAAINYRFKTQLVVCQGNLTARRYIDQVLRPVVVPPTSKPGLPARQRATTRCTCHPGLSTGEQYFTLADLLTGLQPY